MLESSHATARASTDGPTCDSPPARRPGSHLCPGAWIALVLTWLVLPATASGVDVFLNDGVSHTIDHDDYQADRVVIRNGGCEGYGVCDSPGPPTIVRVVDGALIDRMIVYDTSEIRIRGGVASSGSPDNVRAVDESRIIMTGGLAGYQLRAEEDSTVIVRGGTVGQSFIATDNALAILEGGDVQGSFSGYDNAELWLEGGAIEVALGIHQSSDMTVLGGDLGALDRIEAFDIASRIYIQGSNFSTSAGPIGYGLVPGVTGTLSGTLQSGEPIDNNYYHDGYNNDSKAGKIYVPEPGFAPLQICALVLLAALRPGLLFVPGRRPGAARDEG